MNIENKIFYIEKYELYKYIYTIRNFCYSKIFAIAIAKNTNTNVSHEKNQHSNCTIIFLVLFSSIFFHI